MEDEGALLLLAGRATAARRMPYLSKALYAIRPVESEGLRTAGVDRFWRMYWNRSFIEGLSTEEVATVWLHEVGHLMRDHGRRAEASMVPDSLRRQWNEAADAPINGDLRESGVTVFDWMVFPESIDPEATYRDTTEYLYEKITNGQPPPDQHAGDGASDPDGNESGDSEPDSNGGESADDDDSGEGNGDDSEPGGDEGDDNDSVDGEGDEANDGEGDATEGDATGGDTSEPGDSESGSPSPGERGADCGSGAGGGQREWELPPDAEDGSVDDGRAQRIRTQVAQDVMDHVSRGIGTVPAGLERWAEQFLKPQVDWRRELRASVRRLVANHLGRSDYSYQRPRRVPGARGVLFPGMVDRKPPVVRAVVDTSGSMDSEQLGYCVAEIGEIVRQISRGGGAVDVMACDAAISIVQTIRRPGNIDLSGGGGTDMRVGIRAAADLLPMAHIIITITDGFTPWPDKAPEQNREARYLAVIVPPDRPTLSRGNPREASNPPAWMHTIRMQGQ